MCLRLAIPQLTVYKPVDNDHPRDPPKRGCCTLVVGLSFVFHSKLLFHLVWPGLDWPLLTGGRCSEVVVKTGLIVLCIIVIIVLMLSLSLCL